MSCRSIVPARSMLALAVLASLLLPACSMNQKRARRGKPGLEERGLASWYGPGFHGRQTANGETYDMHALTAAHKYLPFDSVVEVTNRQNGRRVTVRINDRGPFVRGRIIDLSRAAAEQIDLVGTGVAEVRLKVVAAGSGTSEGGLNPAQWMVQAGAFRSQAGAERHLFKVQRIESRARLASDGGWHRVLIGPFSRQREARRVAEALERNGTAAIVRRSRLR